MGDLIVIIAHTCQDVSLHLSVSCLLVCFHSLFKELISLLVISVNFKHITFCKVHPCTQ